MKWYREPLLWIMIIVLSIIMVLLTRMSTKAGKSLEDYQRALLNEKTQFIEQCLEDGYSKTDCVVKYKQR